MSRVMNKLNQARQAVKESEAKSGEQQVNPVQQNYQHVAPVVSVKAQPNKLMYLSVLALIALAFVMGLLVAHLNKGQNAQIKDMQESIEKQQQAIESLRSDLMAASQQQDENQVKLINQVKANLSESLSQSDAQIKTITTVVNEIKLSNVSTQQQVGSFKMMLDGLRLQLDKLNKKVFDLSVRVDDKASTTIVK